MDEDTIPTFDRRSDPDDTPIVESGGRDSGRDNINITDSSGLTASAFGTETHQSLDNSRHNQDIIY